MAEVRDAAADVTWAGSSTGSAAAEASLAPAAVESMPTAELPSAAQALAVSIRRRQRNIILCGL